jgi:DNA invertase Pin-like site-specific DNA recombinase
MALVYSYIRFSTRKQMEGDSFRRQVEEGTAWIKKHDHTAASLTLHDLGVSAFRGKNKHAGALCKFLDAVHEERVRPGAILLVENLDRLSRQGVDEAYDLFRKILKAGVRIAVLRPYEAIYNAESLNDIIALLMPLLYFHLAFIESKNKSDRVRASWDAKRKRAAESGRRFGGPRPAWLDRDESTGAFIPNAGAEGVRYIFARTADGCSQRQLLGELHQQHPAIGRSGEWNGSYIHKVLGDRAVLGEFQLYRFDGDGHRVPTGNPLAGYYPAVVDEPLFYRAQAAKARNAKKKGPNGSFVNLFTGLVFNANDGHPMHLQVTTGGPRKQAQRRLVSYGHHRKIPGSDPASVDLDDFERAVLSELREIHERDVLPRPDGAASLRSKEQELTGVRERLAALQGELANTSSTAAVGALAAAARSLGEREDVLKADVERLREETHAGRPLGQVRQVADLLREAREEELDSLRRRLRSLIAELVESIYVKPQKLAGRVYARLQLNYRNGLFRQATMFPHFTLGTPEAGPIDKFPVDLRDREAARSVDVVRFSTDKRPGAGYVCLPAGAVFPGGAPGTEEAVPLPAKLPRRLGEAAELWLRVVRAGKRRDSFKTVPPKVQRFVKVLGADRETKMVDTAAWKRWTAYLKGQVKSGEMKALTARVAYSRAREFVRWLIEHKLAAPIDGLLQSADGALGGWKAGRNGEAANGTATAKRRSAS